MKRLITLLFCLGVSIISYAAEVNFSISVDKKKSAIGDAVQLNLAFEGTQDISAPEISDIEGFSVRYLGPSTQITVTNGKYSTSVTHIYYLVPLKTGTFKVGPFVVNYKGNTYTSNGLSLEVVEGTPLPQGKSSDVSGNIDLNDRIFLVIQADKDKVYLNEKFGVSIKLYIINNLAVRNVQYPQLNYGGFSISKYEQPQQYQETVGGMYYDVVEFKTEAFATKVGSLTIGPAALNCEFLVKKERGRSPFDDFFTTWQPLTLNAPQIPVTVVSLPESNKPQDFSNAVGEFDFDVEVNPREVKTGDPITLRLMVKGEGNFDTVSAQGLKFKEEDFKVYEPQTSFNQGVKIFEYAVIPKNDKVKEIPRLSFNFFDTKEEKYRVIEKGPFEIVVHKSEVEESKIIESPSYQTQKIIEPQKLGRDIIYIKDSLGKVSKRGQYLYKNKWFLLGQFLPLLVFVITLRIYKHYNRLKTDEFYARKLKAPKIARQGLKELNESMSDNHIGKFYETMFRILQKYLGFKLHMPWRGITIDIVEALKNKGIEADILERVNNLFSECDMARYSPLEFGKEKMKSSLENLKLVIERLEKRFR